jgi:hypothetical protein
MANKIKVLMKKSCVICGNEFQQKHYSSGPDGNFKNRKFCGKVCFGKSISVKVDAKTRRRMSVLKFYGGKCMCCGETEPKFLTLDHVNNDGAKHRKEIGQSSIYRWVEINGFPKTIQILCFNCNMAKGLYGKCPHA